jgi:hypothetical protein
VTEVRLAVERILCSLSIIHKALRCFLYILHSAYEMNDDSIRKIYIPRTLKLVVTVGGRDDSICIVELYQYLGVERNAFSTSHGIFPLLRRKRSMETEDNKPIRMTRRSANTNPCFS